MPVLFFCIAFATACSGIDIPRPNSWPTAVESLESCPDIAGSFYNRAEDRIDSEPKTEGFLYDELTKEGIYGTHECGSCPVEIKWEDSERQTLVVTLTDHGEYPRLVRHPEVISTKLQQSAGDFKCQDGKLLIEYVFGTEGLGVEGFLEKGTRYFEKATDGSLLRKAVSDSYAHILVVVPMIFHDVVDYKRWLPFEFDLTEPESN